MYTRQFIPAEQALISTPETASKWPHLEPVADKLHPLQDCDICMLIGINCPQALAPRETVMGQNNEPYAVKTDLGWSVVGSWRSVRRCCDVPQSDDKGKSYYF